MTAVETQEGTMKTNACQHLDNAVCAFCDPPWDGRPRGDEAPDGVRSNGSAQDPSRPMPGV